MGGPEIRPVMERGGQIIYQLVFIAGCFNKRAGLIAR